MLLMVVALILENFTIVALVFVINFLTEKINRLSKKTVESLEIFTESQKGVTEILKDVNNDYKYAKKQVYECIEEIRRHNLSL